MDGSRRGLVKIIVKTYAHKAHDTDTPTHPSCLHMNTVHILRRRQLKLTEEQNNPETASEKGNN